MMRKAPSLVDLCVHLAIDNVRYIGDVGVTDQHLLDRILPHCSLEQLTHIENSTKGRDLSPITDKLWKKFYDIQFGVDSTNAVIKKMKLHNVTYTWRELYEAKAEEREEATKLSLERIKLRYQEENARKQSRQVKLCAKAPPASKKRSFSGGAVASNICNTKGSLMKKAKIDFVNSREVQNIAALNNKVVQRNHSNSSNGKPRNTPPGCTSSSSSSKFIKPPQRRF